MKWLPISEAPTDYTEVIGMDHRGRIFRTWYFAPSSRTKDWLRCDNNRPWFPEWFILIPEKEENGEINQKTEQLT